MTFDNAGVPTLVTSEVINAATSPVTINPSNGFASVSAVGQSIKLNLQDPYVRLLGVTATGVVGTGTVASGSVAVIVDDVKSNTAPFLRVGLLEPVAGTPITMDPTLPTDSTVLFSVTLANSTAL